MKMGTRVIAHRDTNINSITTTRPVARSRGTKLCVYVYVCHSIESKAWAGLDAAIVATHNESLERVILTGNTLSHHVRPATCHAFWMPDDVDVCRCV